MKVVNLKQNSDEWLEYRRNKIGASDAPIIAGVSPYKTQLKLWREKLGLSVNDYKSAAMQRGVMLEPSARALYEKIHGVRAASVVVQHPRYDWMVASLDGYDEVNKIVLEIKCSGMADHQKALNGEIPRHYYPQLQHQLAVTGLDKAHYFSYYSDTDYALVECFRDQKYIDELIEKEKKFYDCMINFVEPEIILADYTLRIDNEWQELAAEYANLDSQEKLIKCKKDEIKDKLIKISAGEDSMGHGISLQQRTRKGSIQYSIIPQLVGIDLEKYRSHGSTYWQISIKK